MLRRVLMMWGLVTSRMVCSAMIFTAAVVNAGGAAKADEPPAGEAVRWTVCDPARLASVGVEEMPPGLQCGSLEVPVDYSAPDRGTLTLALVRVPATGPKIGSLVVNPGGPGESGVATVTWIDDVPDDVRRQFDFVGFDPRGVGLSTPAVRCNTDAELDAWRADPKLDWSAAGVDRIDGLTRQYAQRCLDRVGRDFLANAGTVNVARDLDLLRAAVGDEKLTYLGYSYGTFIGSTYAEAFPQNVRAMILDGVIDPQADPFQDAVDGAAAFQQAFDDYAADCARDNDCPLGTDTAKAVAVFRTLVEPTVDQPAATADPRGLGRQDALTGTNHALYSPARWADLTQGLSELSRGQGDALLALADEYWGRDADGHYANSSDILDVVNCVDSPPITDRATVVELNRRMEEAAPYQSDGTFTGFAPLSMCAMWPFPPTSFPHQVSAPGLPPVLVVSTTGDPATPYQAGVNLARDLGSPLLTYEATQHTVVFEGEECVDAYATAYLIDLVLPPPDATC